MIADGCSTRFPMEAVFGMHNWPGVPVGQIAVHRGPVMACADRFDIEIRATAPTPPCPSGHRPGAVRRVAGAGAAVGGEPQCGPADSAVLSVTQFHAGDAYNVIPDVVRIGGTVQTFRPDIRPVEDAMHPVCARHQRGFQCQRAFRIQPRLSPTINTMPEAEFCARVAPARCGEGSTKVIDPKPSMGAEDFAYFLQEKPGCYVWLGNGPGRAGCAAQPHLRFQRRRDSLRRGLLGASGGTPAC